MIWLFLFFAGCLIFGVIKEILKSRQMEKDRRAKLLAYKKFLNDELTMTPYEKDKAYVWYGLTGNVTTPYSKRKFVSK